MPVYIASDHRGFELKGKIIAFLETAGVEAEDLGPKEYVPTDDYPDYAFALGEKVAEEKGKGILICGSGVGMVVAVNKVKGIRASMVETPEAAVLSRQDDDMNVLVFDVVTFNQQKDFEIIEAWLNTPFSGAERHVRRIKKITDYENEN